MPRSFTIHPASLALGLVIAGVAFVAMGQATVPTPLRVEYVPHPRDHLEVRDGTTYVVPPGKILVVTAIGTTDGSGGAALNVDGQLAYTSGQGGMQSVPARMTVPPGSAVAVVAAGNGRAWGYLVNQ